MTGRWLLEQLVKELDPIPRYLTSDNFNIVVKKLKKNPQVIFIDEIDYLINNYKTIETLRDIHDETVCLIILSKWAWLTENLNATSIYMTGLARL